MTAAAPPSVLVGRSQRATRKDEDTLFVRAEASHHCVAVFDGSGRMLMTVDERVVSSG